MSDLVGFRNKVVGYLSMTLPGELEKATQAELAREIGLDPSVLSRRLNGRESLTENYVKAIVKVLVKMGRIQSKGEARYLLNFMDIHDFDPPDWDIFPLNQLRNAEPLSELARSPLEPSLLPTIAAPPLSPQSHPSIVTPPSLETPYSKSHVSRRAVLAGLIVTGVATVSIVAFVHRFPPSPSSPETSQHEAEKWKATGSMLLSRQYFRATPLKTGMVLIEGGSTSNGFDTAESELFNPLTRVWIKTRGRLNERRSQHTATLLLNEKVLITGGYSSEGGRDSAELYDPATDRWILTKQKMIRTRSRHTATLLLSSGKVLVVGGVEGILGAGQPLASAEIYDPATNTWSLAGRMATPRADHIAVLMLDGKVLVAGGTQKNDGHTKTNEAEVYDPSMNSWTSIQKMHKLRAYFTAVLTPTGQVLAIGGRSDDGYNSTITAEIYDPVTRSWSMTNDMTYSREVSLGQDTVVLNDGRILVVGGDSSGTSEIYSPAIDAWTTPLKMNSVRSYSATAKLKSGQILVAGGSDCLCNNSHILASTEIYTPT